MIHEDISWKCEKTNTQMLHINHVSKQSQTSNEQYNQSRDREQNQKKTQNLAVYLYSAVFFILLSWNSFFFFFPHSIHRLPYFHEYTRIMYNIYIAKLELCCVFFSSLNV